jgi:hypothetical protein
MKIKFIFLLITLGFLTTSCSKDEDSSNSNVTSAKIKLTNASGQPAANFVVYAYDESTWEVIGNQSQFADFQSSSDSNGEAIFANLHSEIRFRETNNYIQTFRFSVSYTLNGVQKNKVKAITINRGDNKTDTIVLD